MTLEELAVDHPYYCSDSNYYSNEASTEWACWADFYDEFGHADIDLNLCFRWDVERRDSGGFSAQISMMGQRKGLYKPHRIAYIGKEDVDSFVDYITRHWEVMQAMWNPLITEETEQPEEE